MLTHQGGQAATTAMKCRMMTVGKPVWRVGLSILPGSAAHRESVTKSGRLRTGYGSGVDLGNRQLIGKWSENPF